MTSTDVNYATLRWGRTNKGSAPPHPSSSPPRQTTPRKSLSQIPYQGTVLNTNDVSQSRCPKSEQTTSKRSRLDRWMSLLQFGGTSSPQSSANGCSAEPRDRSKANHGIAGSQHATMGKNGSTHPMTVNERRESNCPQSSLDLFSHNVTPLNEPTTRPSNRATPTRRFTLSESKNRPRSHPSVSRMDGNDPRTGASPVHPRLSAAPVKQ